MKPTTSLLKKMTKKNDNETNNPDSNDVEQLSVENVNESTDTHSVKVVENSEDDEVFDSALTEEIVNHKESFFSKTKTIIALIIAGGFLIGLLVFAIHQLGLQASRDNDVRPVPPVSQTEAPTANEIAEKQSLVANTNEETVNIIGEQLAIEFGEDVYETVTLATATDNVDENGVPAFVALATYANVPEEFNVENSAQFFIEQLRDIPGDWVYIEETDPPVGVDRIYALKLYDQSSDPENPVIIDIIYFVETLEDTGTDSIQTLTITITATAY